MTAWPGLRALRCLRDCGCVSAGLYDLSFVVLVAEGLATASDLPKRRAYAIPRRVYRLTPEGKATASALPPTPGA